MSTRCKICGQPITEKQAWTHLAEGGFAHVSCTVRQRPKHTEGMECKSRN
ncbi:MAG: hypothetical protein IKN41_04925 [Candidatus Methanomethylophilaceae archaeon]|nr:hypothetical protein [Candidatus Methanomethylophilaceae archaeon]